MRLNPSDQERRYKEQGINQNKDNTNTNNINGKFEISVIANCINNSFENVNNSAMKDTDNMKEITKKNIDSNKQIKESTEKDVRRNEKIIRNVSENCKNAPFEKILENNKANFKCNFENDLKHLRKKNMHKIVVGQLNIISIQNKFDHLMVAVSGNIDILLITETKIDSTFPVNQFYLNGYNVPYRNDRNTNGGGILVYIRDDIRSRIIKCENLPISFEGLVVELSFNLKKWLLICP